MEYEIQTKEHASLSASTEKKNDFSIPLAIVVAGVFIAGAIIFSNKTVSTSPSLPTNTGDQPAAVSLSKTLLAELTLRADDHIFGNPNANTLIVEYSDPECPFCKQFHQTMIQVMDQYGKDGSVAWVYRHFPLDQLHPKARKEAEALECANEAGGNVAFWKYTTKLFEVTPSNNGLDAAQLPQIASEIGLDVATFNTCLLSGKYAARVQKDSESGANIGVKGTPFSIVWNKKTGKQAPIEGAYPIENVKSIVESVMK